MSLRTKSCHGHDPDRCGNRGFSKNPSTTRAVLLQVPQTHAVLHCHVQLQKGVWPKSTKTEGHGLFELDLLCVQTPLFREQPFPFFQSFMTNQEASNQCSPLPAQCNMAYFGLLQSRQRMKALILLHLVSLVFFCLGIRVPSFSHDRCDSVCVRSIP